MIWNGGDGEGEGREDKDKLVEVERGEEKR